MKGFSKMAEAFLVCVLALSCSRMEEYDLSWLDEIMSDLPEALDWINDAYNLEMTYVIDHDTYIYDGSDTLVTTYTAATEEQAVATAEYMEAYIFPLFPEGFIKSYMPATIYVADTVYYEYSYEVDDYDIENSKHLHSLTSLLRTLYGESGSKCSTFAASCLCPDIGSDEEISLRFEWTSLMIERMMANTDKWPEPTDFTSYTSAKFKEYTIYWPYYQDTYSVGRTTFSIPLSPATDEFNIWYYCGTIRGPRYGYELNFVYTQAYLDKYYPTGTVDHYCYPYMTYRQEFADYIAYQLIYGDKWEDFLEGIDGLTYAKDPDYVCSRETFETKLEYVKTYMLSRFGWDITKQQ